MKRKETDMNLFDAFSSLVERFDVRIVRSDSPGESVDIESIHCNDRIPSQDSIWLLRSHKSDVYSIRPVVQTERMRLAETVREYGTIFARLSFSGKQGVLLLIPFSAKTERIDEAIVLGFEPETEESSSSPVAKANESERSERPDPKEEGRRFDSSDFMANYGARHFLFLLPENPPTSSADASFSFLLFGARGFFRAKKTVANPLPGCSSKREPGTPRTSQFRGLVPIEIHDLSFKTKIEHSSEHPLFVDLLRRILFSGSKEVGGTKYFQVWSEYLRIEEEIFHEDLQENGWLQYGAPRPAGLGRNDWYVPIRGILSAAARKALHQATEQKPVLLKWWEHRPEALDEAADNADFFTGISAEHDTDSRYEVVEFDANEITLTRKPPAGGGFTFDSAGDRIQLDRERNALDAVRNKTGANPRIAKFFLSAPLDAVARTVIPAASAETNALLQANNRTLNESQWNAVSIALNTPDVALIQGPPGTGKTTVIEVILQRLFEQFRDEGFSSTDNPLTGRVLLSGFQHDAVENLVSHIKLMGLPVPKFGNRRNQGGDGTPNEANDDESVRADSFRQAVEKWSEKLSDDLNRRFPALGQFADADKVTRLASAYRASPSELTRSILLSAIRDSGSVGEEVRTIAAEALAGMNRGLKSTESSDPSRKNAAWNLRTTASGFADDGPARAADVLEAFRGELDHDTEAVLVKASGWLPGTPLDDGLLKALAGIRNRLLESLLEPPAFAVPRPEPKVLSIAQRAVEDVQKRLEGQNPVLAALYRFRCNLNGNPYGVMDSIVDYSCAFAATCQQSVNRRIVRQKGASSADARYGEFQRYDYVIIDEAARPSPLDLLVAAVQGRRVILVGDHKQLPPMTDEEILNKLQARTLGNSENGEAGDSEWRNEARDILRRSCFEWLLGKPIQNAKEADGIERKVMLNTQYRMHPALGDFLSEQFYDQKLESGLGADCFKHKLPGTGGLPACWEDVPTGRIEPRGRSWIRKTEAERIIEKLFDWYTDPEGGKLTYGVISFYKEQAVLLERQMSDLFGGRLPANIRVGTVDAFQGQEFDVVLLSVVRTPKIAYGSHPFGHLESPNRMNVAMSRQKRLLVVVGDSRLLEADRAQKLIPALVAFKKLCDQMKAGGTPA